MKNLLSKCVQHRDKIVSLVTIFVCGVVWYILTLNIVPEIKFPSPKSVWGVFINMNSSLIENWPDSFQEAILNPTSIWAAIFSSKLLSYSTTTLYRVLFGWSVGVLLGVITGLMLSWNRVIFSILNPIIEAVRPLPPIALMPFFIIWFGLGDSGQIILIALGCYMVMTIDTYVSIHNIPKIYIRAGASLGASQSRIFLTIILPYLLPSLFAGFRISSALAFGTGVAAELMGAQGGLGYMIMVARRSLETDAILLGIIIIGLQAYIVDYLIRLAASYVLKWSETPFDEVSDIRVAKKKE